MHRWLTLIALALFALATIGCVSDPVIRIDHAKIAGADAKGVSVVMTMSITNDNSFDVLVHDVKANIVLDNVHFLPPVSTSPNVWLPAKQTTPLQIPVLVPWDTANHIMQSTSPTISYRAKGVANVTGSRTLKVSKVYPIDEQGSFSRADLGIPGAAPSPPPATVSPAAAPAPAPAPVTAPPASQGRHAPSGL